jgi:hypothetical protein
MKRFLIAAALAAVASLALADRASAQVVYGYNTGVNPYNGTMTYNRTVITPFSAQQSSGYYNPNFGYGGQRYQYSNAFGTNYATGYGVSPFGGGYNYGVYQPGYGVYGPAPLYRVGYGPVYPGLGTVYGAPPVYRTGFGFRW